MTPDQERWQHARTLNDLGHLTAEWLEGTSTYLPAYATDGDATLRPDPETAPLIPHLAHANRNGYVTTHSQPGIPIEDGCGQRASVDGFCTEADADLIQAACLETGLIVIATPPGRDNPTRIPITLDDGDAFTHIGANHALDDIVHDYAKACPAALHALVHAWQVAVIDPEWGRRDLLWTTLDSVWNARA